ncbi:DUF3426 domain-containing protein [Dechloromonas sp.]|uniref:DUF3426 domain-containing protein n=1 Tax=Dechloromonas sp. TaxID=1917218 RepID=UPI0011FCD9E0|nr:DUF3426 domain-containing protein [Dechloromonas sp.]TEX46097.1 MAG: hypothetical protein CFR70_12375 [Rhodocyclaceae bacterium]
MRTRCPECGTIFRVTSEQLRLKAGKVRCGHCEAVFNAFDHLQQEPEVATHPDRKTGHEVERVVSENIAWTTNFVPEPERAGADKKAVSALPSVDESVEASTEAARDAGLVAARDLAETPAYNRWAAGTLAGNGLGSFEPELRPRLVWPFALVAVLLLLALSSQLFYHFRTELSIRFPSLSGVYLLAGVAVPLPRNADRVAIESSDLQSDNARGLFVLQATLQNRADYAQDWPALELSMTDTHDTVVTRKVLLPADYLPPGTPPDAFAANGELAVRLWIEAKDIGAAGYRLFVFYP